jgi:hypothetical protein
MNQERTREEHTASAGLSDLEHDLAVLADQARDAVEQLVHERPHVALGLAAALGFVIGGGLTPRRLLRIGVAAGGPALSRQIASQVARFASEMWLQPEEGGTASEEASSGRGRRFTKQGQEE